MSIGLSFTCAVHHTPYHNQPHIFVTIISTRNWPNCNENYIQSCEQKKMCGFNVHMCMDLCGRNNWRIQEPSKNTTELCSILLCGKSKE